MTTHQHPELSNRLLFLMTIATGLCVANIVYAQPLLVEIQRSLGGVKIVSDARLGWIPTLTQIGYACGMLFIVPLGDRYERRAMIFIFSIAAACALFTFAIATHFYVICLASFGIGLLTMTPQLLVPFAAHLAQAHKRGRVIGTIMSGLLLGILLGRTVAGFVGAVLGWRMLFTIAAGGMCIMAIILRSALPTSIPTFSGSYRKLIASVFHLIRTEPTLRESMLFGGALFAAFSAFWATVIQLMESPAFNLGARTVGLFGVLGAAGALTASISGRLADRYSARVITGVGIAITASAFLIYLFWGAYSLIGVGLGVVVMDIGVQAGHIACQSRVFAINEHARSRLNTAYMCCYFTCGGIGSLIASYAWNSFGWNGVCFTGLIFLAIGAIEYSTRILSR